MKRINKKTIIYYYICLSLILVGQAVFSCTQLARTVSYQQKILGAQAHEKQLHQQFEEKQALLTTKRSLVLNQQSIGSEYSPIASAIVISSPQSLALR